METYLSDLLYFLHTGKRWLQWIFGVHVYFSLATNQEGKQAHELMSDPESFPTVHW